MPELPEVETVVRDLRAAGLIGRRIIGADVFWPRTIAEPPVPLFRKGLTGRGIVGVDRRAKYIIIALDDDRRLLIHLRMTGRLHFEAAGTVRARHEHVILHLDDGRTLRFTDTRKFGRWHLVSLPAAQLECLGPEPLAPGFTVRVLGDAVRGRARLLKPLLLDQTVVAGLGNIYVDEALWDARLHPCRDAATLTASEVTALHAAIRRVLRRGIRSHGTTLGSGETNFYSVSGRRGRNKDGLKVFRRQGCPCSRCGAVLQRITVGQRSTHLCPACQEEG